MTWAYICRMQPQIYTYDRTQYALDPLLSELTRPFQSIRGQVRFHVQTDIAFRLFSSRSEQREDRHAFILNPSDQWYAGVEKVDPTYGFNSTYIYRIEAVFLHELYSSLHTRVTSHRRWQLAAQHIGRIDWSEVITLASGYIYYVYLYTKVIIIKKQSEPSGQLLVSASQSSLS